MKVFLCIAVVLALTEFSSAFFLQREVDIRNLQYPRKSFLETLFTGPEQPQEIPADLRNLRYPTDSFLSALIARTVSGFSGIMVRPENPFEILFINFFSINSRALQVLILLRLSHQ
jgi:hypothetical protein